jgi:Cdc6-like AAA superfamily ATPase
MEDDDIIKYWITPGPLSDLILCGSDLISSPPILFMGGRGCGKTMILKYMSNEIQIKKSNFDEITKEEFLANFHFIGIYYRFDGPSLSIFQKRNVSEIEWETIFRHYLEIVICKKYIQMLDNLKTYNYLDINEKTNKKLIRDLEKHIFDSSESEPENSTFEFIIEKLESLSKKVFNFINRAPFTKNPKFESDFIFSSGSLIFGVPKIIANNIPSFKRKKFIILLDEYENASKQQQLIINTLIKHVQPPVNFLIGSRYYGIKTFDTMNKDEFLMEDADYRTISFEDVMSDNDYIQFIQDIAKKRLEKAEDFRIHKIFDIEKILGYFSPEDEARKIVYGRWIKKIDKNDFDTYKLNKHIVKLRGILIQKTKKVDSAYLDNVIKNLVCEENPLIDMLNMVLITRGKYSIDELQKITQLYLKNEKTDPRYKIYDQLYDKNKLALVFQLISYYPPTQKEYAGFRVFAMLSSGLIRNFIELCYQSFKNDFFYYSGSIVKKRYIDFEMQTKSANIRSEKFFNTIENIPEYGNEIKSLVQSLGAIYSSWYSDPRISEPEITYFFVDKTTLSPKVKQVLDKAVQWSVLQQKEPMKGKTPGDPLLDVYVLNHILAPKFSISYRSRGRIPQFIAEDLELLMFGNDNQKSQTTNKLMRNSLDFQQMSIFESWK